MKRTRPFLDLDKIAGHTFTAISHLGKWFPAKIDLATGNSTKLLFGFTNRDDAITYALDNFDNPDVDITCANCGGNNVLKDAYASWNVELQQWELSTVFDHTVCDDCDSTSSPIETPIQNSDAGVS